MKRLPIAAATLWLSSASIMLGCGADTSGGRAGGANTTSFGTGVLRGA